MIQENEIMCGNYFIHNDNWCSREHKGIFQFDSQHFYELHECIFSLENIEPIPLTEDILIRCGFKEFINPANGTYYFNLNEVWVQKREDFYYLRNCSINKKVSDLHTLQNLVKLLCNQTIELK